MTEAVPHRQRSRLASAMLFLAGVLVVPLLVGGALLLPGATPPARRPPMVLVSLVKTLSPYQKWLVATAPAPRHPMAFMLVPAHSPCRKAPCDLLVLGQGEITRATPSAFADFLHRARPSHPEGVVLSSNGGNFQSGLALGALIREAGLATRLRTGDTCQSACAYAFLGGIRRSVDAGAAYGVHVGGIIATDLHASTDQGFTAADMQSATVSGFRAGVGNTGLLMKYLAAMGVDEEYLAATMHSYGDTYNLSPACMAWLRVTTTVPRPRRDPCPGVAGIQAFLCPAADGPATRALHAVLDTRRRCTRPNPNAVVLH